MILCLVCGYFLLVQYSMSFQLFVLFYSILLLLYVDVTLHIHTHATRIIIIRLTPHFYTTVLTILTLPYLTHQLQSPSHPILIVHVLANSTPKNSTVHDSIPFPL